MYHVLGASVLSGDLSDDQTATTLLGQNIEVNISSDGVFINNAKVSVTDIHTFNGVVHVLDAVLLPPAKTVAEVVINSPEHTTLEAAVIAAELAETLSGEGSFTVFAPTDAAFDALPAGTLDVLLADPTGDLAQILLYHVLGQEVLSSDLSNGQMATTVQGQDIEVTINNDGVFINNAQVTVADIRTYNGVVHVIDAVILPNLTSVRNVEEVKIQVAPNPASTFLSIQLPSTMIDERVEARLVSLDGRVLRQWVLSGINEVLDVEAFATGTYILFLQSEKSFSRNTIMID